MQLGKEAKESILRGVNRVADAVVVTAGAEGKFAVIEHPMALTPHPTKDGVTVLNAVYGKDQYEELGAQLLKQAANRTAEVSGDGTTVTTILSRELINQSLTLENVSHIDVKNGMNKAFEQVRSLLHALKKEVTEDEMEDIATVSANNDREIGKLVADIYKKTGVDVTIDVKEGVLTENKVDFVEGVKLDRGIALPHFYTDYNKEVCELSDVEVLIYHGEIKSVEDVAPYIRECLKEKKSLHIVADDVAEPVMAMLLRTKRDGVLQLCVSISPDFGENRTNVLTDLAVALGSEVYDPKENKGIAKLGKAKKIFADKNQTVILPYEKGLEKERVEMLKEQLEKTDKLDRDKLKRRISNLSSAIVEISVGGTTDMEIKEKKDRIEDAVPALHSALKEGYVAGGGAALYYISSQLKNNLKGDERKGFEIVKKAIKKPMIQILENASLKERNFKKWYQNSIPLEYGYGVNVKSRKFVNMFEDGIIDPALIPEKALENAVSVASLAISTDVLILTNFK